MVARVTVLTALLTSAFAAPLNSTVNTGKGTYYNPALGARGITNTDADMIVAVSHIFFDSFPGANPVNPNLNPLCNKKLTASYGRKDVTVTITDRCTECAEFDLDFATAAYEKLSPTAVSPIQGVAWSLL